MKTRIISLVATLFVLLAGVSLAQENESRAPAQIGPYSFFGTLSAGYRTALDVKGFEDRLTSDNLAERLFHEQYQYDPSNGVPALSLNLFGERPIGGEGFFDQMFLNSSYDGGNFIGSLRLRTFGAYDFKVDYKRSNYFFDRFDSIFSDLRQFDHTRQILNASLTVTPIEMLDVQVMYSGTGRSGDQQIPRTPFLELTSVPSSFQWAGYGRANFFLMETPRDDWANRFSGQVTARLPMTSITAGGGFRTFTEDLKTSPALLSSLNNLDSLDGGPVPNEFGIIGTSLPDEPLSSYRWNEKRESSGPFAYGQVVFKPIDMISATASVNWQKTEGEATIDAAQTGIIRMNSSGSKLREYRASYAGSSHDTLDRLTASLMLSGRPIPQLQVLAGVQYQKDKQGTAGHYSGTLDTAINGGEVTEGFRMVGDSLNHFGVATQFDIPTTSLIGEVSYAPLPNLNLRGGVRYEMRTPEVLRYDDHGHEAELNEAYSADLSEKTTMMRLRFNAFYRPIDEVALRARVENITRDVTLDNETSKLARSDADDPTLTPRRTLKNDLGFGGSIDVNPIDDLSISLGGDIRGGENDLLIRTLNPVATGPDSLKTLMTLGPADLSKVEDRSKSFSGSISYKLPLNSTITLTGDYQQYDFQIPMVWNRVTGGVNGWVPNPQFTPDSLGAVTVLVEERTIDRTYGATISTQPIEGLTVALGFDYIRSTGGSQLTPGTADWEKAFPPTTTMGAGFRDMGGDYSRLNGPYTRWEGSAYVQYDFLSNLGLGVNALMVQQKDDKTGAYVALNNFKATQLTFSLIARL
jgi:hypothetical protein